MQSERRTSGQRRRRAWLRDGLVAAAALVVPALAVEAEEPTITRVEEDWKLVLNVPDDWVVAPQFHTVMSPFPNQDLFYFQSTYNYRELPEFQSGGLQLQAWLNDKCLSTKNIRTEPLSYDADTVTWTQQLKTNGTNLVFQVFNGQSNSWGSFGGEGTAIQLGWTGGNLNTYSPSVSAAGSYITYGSNRVDLLAITQVRYYADNTLVTVDDTLRVVYEYEEPDGAPEDPVN